MRVVARSSYHFDNSKLRRLAEILYNDSRENLKDKKTIWTQNAQADYWKSQARFEGDVGKIYGVQWRNFNGEDQVLNLIKGLKEDPNGRRHIISAWNPPEIKNMSLPAKPCFRNVFLISMNYMFRGAKHKLPARTTKII